MVYFHLFEIVEHVESNFVALHYEHAHTERKLEHYCKRLNEFLQVHWHFVIYFYFIFSDLPTLFKCTVAMRNR
jgi:hypothetical protein